MRTCRSVVAIKFNNRPVLQLKLLLEYVTKYVTMRFVKLLIINVFMLCLTLLIC